jgi:hypothetical protein
MNFGKSSYWWHRLALVFFIASTALAWAGDDMPGRDPRQAIDAEYTKKILE